MRAGVVLASIVAVIGGVLIGHYAVLPALDRSAADTAPVARPVAAVRPIGRLALPDDAQPGAAENSTPDFAGCLAEAKARRMDAEQARQTCRAIVPDG